MASGTAIALLSILGLFLVICLVITYVLWMRSNYAYLDEEPEDGRGAGSYQPPNLSGSGAGKGSTSSGGASQVKGGHRPYSGLSVHDSVDNYEAISLLGEGAFAKVFLARRKDTREIVALKAIDKQRLVDKDDIQHTMAERNILAKVNHPFLVHLQSSFQTDTTLYFVLDYVGGGELFQYLKHELVFPSAKAAFYAAEILLAVEYLHSLDIIYRDLKPENILIGTDGHLRITDFGLSKERMTAGQKTATLVGTPEYVAPEILRGKGHGREVDWWCLGILIYEMRTGAPPFADADKLTMYKKTLKGTYVLPSHLTPAECDIITKLLSVDPRQRLGVNGVEEIKSHPFFEKIDFEAILAKKVTPPYIPKTSSATDTSHFSRDFTQKEVTVLRGSSPSVGDAHLPQAQSAMTDSAFSGFTFSPVSVLEVQEAELVIDESTESD